MAKCFRSSLAFLFPFIFLLSMASTAYATAGIPTLDSEEWNFLTLINNFRVQNGVAPLQVSVTLQNAATWLANDMAMNNYVGDTDSLGRPPSTRLQAFGYSNSWAEDTAAGHSDAQATFNQWATECAPYASGTCSYVDEQLMLNIYVKVIGIGRAYNAKSASGWYWAVDYGSYVDQTISLNSGTVPAPTIGSFSAVPASITSGQTATLFWAQSGATSVTIDNGIGDVSNTTFKSVSPKQTTTYTLTAADVGGTVIANATIVVAALTDSQPPTVPTLVSAVAKNPTEVDLSWTASTDNTAVTGYRVIRNGSAITTVPASVLSYADASVAPGTTYTFSIEAFDAAGNVSNASNTIQSTTPSLPPPSSTCPGPGAGSFTSCYYADTTLSGNSVYSGNDSQIGFNWTSGFPAKFVAVAPNNFSVRWQGTFSFVQGNYTFSAIASDGMRLYLDGVKVIDSWRDQPPSEYDVPQKVSSGNHLVVVEFYEHTGWG